MDIAAWLRELGLERYEQAFREHEIDAEILPKLSPDDLKDIGITTVGHRRKLLEAITALAEPASAPQAEPSASTEATPEAERRQLTVLFCDLVGSTELAAQLDPEDLREVIGVYQASVAEVVRRWEGHVARYLGDGALAYFGWPRAHEDDAERAVRAGLELVEAVGRVHAGTDTQLAARVGIATGQVVVGDLAGQDSADKDSVVGETPNLAARLQGLAEPGTVVISQATRRLVGGLFELDDLGPQRLKGFAEPLAVWRVEGEGLAEGRFEALHGERLTPLVGREHELGILLERWAWSKDGDGQVVLLSGEPGIGKSRVIRALRERLVDEPYMPLSHYCSPYHTNSALHPVIGLLERAARFDRDELPEERLAKLEALVNLSSDCPGDVVPLLAALLGVPTGERYPALTVTPKVQARRTLQTLVDQLAGVAAQQPVLALYEDVHWIDPSTLELLGLVIERIQRLRVLVLITFRPEFQPPWTGQAHMTTLTMSRLGRRQGADLVARVTGDKPLPGEIVEQIVARTDGVPLFAEELTKVVLESGLLKEEGDRYALAAPLPASEIPATLHDSLIARLDRLAPAAREVAQVGAVIGREFPHELLAAVAPLNGEALTDALSGLVEAELIFRRGSPPASGYVFKHALVRDAAYESLLRGRRRRLHARIAEALEERFPETAEAEPELLAHHCTEAGLSEKAVGYWHRAGQRAIARSAMAEAVPHLRRGLELLAGLPESFERRRRELDLQVALGNALISTKGYAAAETGRVFIRARGLCREAGDTDRLMTVLNGQMLFRSQRGEPDAARKIAVEMLELARRQGDAALLIPAHRAMSLTALHLGRFAEAREHADQVLALYDPAQHRSLALLYSFDQQTVALGYLNVALFALGYPDQARMRSQQQLAAARELAHPNSLVQVHHMACFYYRATGDTEGLREAAEAQIAGAAEHGLPYFLAAGRIFRGQVLIEQGALEEGLAEIEEGVAAWQAAGTALRMNVSGLFAEAHARAGRHGEALRSAAEARAWTETSTSLWFKAGEHWRNGQLLLSLPEPDWAEAEACFRRAIAIAREQEAKIWELRAATSLARLWRDQGKRSEAYDLLAPVYGWFTEGFDTADLKFAKALLDELG